MRRSAVILLVVFALLGALVWYAQQPDNSIKKALATSTNQASQSYSALISSSNGLITRIQIQDAAGKEVIIDKSSGKWMINTGVDAPADQQRADLIAGQLLSLTVVNEFKTAPDPAGTGLDKPAYLATLTQDAGTSTSFKIGKLTATSSGYYVETANGKVSIVNKEAIETLIGNLEKPPFPATATPSVSETPEATSTKAP